MPKRPDTNFEIVETEHEFHEASEKYSSRVTLATKQQEEAYSEIDNRFACSIDQLVKDYLSSEVIEKHYHQNYDWWPTQTRFLSFNAQVVNWDLIKKLRTLVSKSFANWIINIHVFHDCCDGSTEIGSMNIYSHKILITQPLVSYIDQQSA
jgi:hypothetical protein